MTVSPIQHGMPLNNASAEIAALERKEAVQGAAGQAGHDVPVVDGEGEVGVSTREEVYNRW